MPKKTPKNSKNSIGIAQPQGPLSSPGSLCVSQHLCLSSVSPPCCIVSLCRGFVQKSKPANAREQRYLFDLEG